MKEEFVEAKQKLFFAKVMFADNYVNRPFLSETKYVDARESIKMATMLEKPASSGDAKAMAEFIRVANGLEAKLFAWRESIPDFPEYGL